MKTAKEILEEIDKQLAGWKASLGAPYNSHGFKHQIELALDVLDSLRAFIRSEPEPLITKEQALELLNKKGGPSPAAKIEIINSLLHPETEELEKCEHVYLIKTDEFFTGIPKCRLCGHEHIRYKSDALIKAEKWLFGDKK